MYRPIYLKGPLRTETKKKEIIVIENKLNWRKEFKNKQKKSDTWKNIFYKIIY